MPAGIKGHSRGKEADPMNTLAIFFGSKQAKQGSVLTGEPEGTSPLAGCQQPQSTTAQTLLLLSAPRSVCGGLDGQPFWTGSVLTLWLELLLCVFPS